MRETDSTLLCMGHMAGGEARTSLLFHGQPLLLMTFTREAREGFSFIRGNRDAAISLKVEPLAPIWSQTNSHGAGSRARGFCGTWYQDGA